MKLTKLLYKPLAVLMGWAFAVASVAAADLTPMGAEKAGSSDGLVPAWDGGLSKAPAGFDSKKGYADPFAGEKPSFTITAANMAQYKDKLSAGQMEMLKRFPDYKMNVYASHRTAAYPQSLYDAVKSEAGKVTLGDGGNSVKGLVHSTVPFPEPKSGVEVIWNHVMRYRGNSLERYSATFPVQANGNFTPVTITENLLLASSTSNPEPNRLFSYMGLITGPSSVAGEDLLVIEPIDQVKESRQAWLYNPGQRRVMRAPDIAYDSPGQGADGLRTTDDYDGFNGAPDRYDWKLVGKKEMFIAYNNYRLTSKSEKYAEIIKPGHMNQDMVRYEPHRVWVVEATLKPGKRHVYSRRTFYVDEDSWQVAHTDAYDGRGELWRVHEVDAVQYYDVPTLWLACEVEYDLQSRRYVVGGLTSQEKPMRFNIKLESGFFTADNLRRLSN
ncbi:MAG: DUF1329 domain-containing protein [Burkholderiaceae bacterium]|nr:DUF1329 domain-containing protein [Burkholderiaceae bacterium]